MKNVYDTLIAMECKAANCTNEVIGRPYKVFCSDRCRTRTNVTRWRAEAKRKLVEHFGGKCVRCGYSKCMAALHFHHREDDKEFGIAVKGRTRAYDKLIKEAEKCDLVCANCHAEIHSDVG